MATALLKWGRVPLLAAFLVIVFIFGEPAWPQSPALTIILTGQSMIRSDIRASAPSAVPAMAALLKGGDVVFTNFEGTVAEAGQPNENAPRQGRGFLAPPGAIGALKALGFNLLSLSNNHSWDLKVPGIENTL
jgi:poly-gamma-glutamate capsule biosynthesis protein CapA/YwtB (metallophosphatase superfamily)